jgi:hypothetical protein
MRYIEFCAGIGGSRAGLDAAGWGCELAIDSDPFAVAVHAAAFGDCSQATVDSIDESHLPACDAFVAGFPCQPFSSSGARAGFHHRAGNVFEQIARLVAIRRPRVVVLENVQGLLTNKSGHTFSRVLQDLTGLGYTVDWALLDLANFGVPQTRPRVLIAATLAGVGYQVPGSSGSGPFAKSVFGGVMKSLSISVSSRESGSLAVVEEERRPEVGKSSRFQRMPFAFGGRAVGDAFEAWRWARPGWSVEPEALRDVVAPGFAFPEEICSARYWAYDGPSSLHLRNRPISHCVGTSIGGAPIFAVPLELVSSEVSRKRFLSLMNWHREEDGFLVARLSPVRAVRLFGASTERLESALSATPAATTLKYKGVGNMAPPVMLHALGGALSELHGLS